jgi:hypothetical protein
VSDNGGDNIVRFPTIERMRTSAPQSRVHILVICRLLHLTKQLLQRDMEQADSDATPLFLSIIDHLDVAQRELLRLSGVGKE